jgi:hypothetical protein
MSFIFQAGPFGLLTLVVGTIGLCIVLAQTATRRDLQGPATWCAAVALLIGIVGTGVGLDRAATVLATVDDPAQAAMLWRQAVATAASATTLGALASLATLVAMGTATLVRPPRRAVAS